MTFFWASSICRLASVWYVAAIFWTVSLKASLIISFCFATQLSAPNVGGFDVIFGMVYDPPTLCIGFLMVYAFFTSADIESSSSCLWNSSFSTEISFWFLSLIFCFTSSKSLSMAAFLSSICLALPFFIINSHLRLSLSRFKLALSFSRLEIMVWSPLMAFSFSLISLLSFRINSVLFRCLTSRPRTLSPLSKPYFLPTSS